MREDLYVLCCLDLHAARGPVVGLELAIKLAARLTDTSDTGCKYVPVLFAPVGKIQALGEDPDGEETQVDGRYDNEGDRGYL